MNLPISLCLLLLGTLIPLMSREKSPILVRVAIVLPAFLSFCLIASTSWEVLTTGSGSVWSVEWVPEFGIDLSLQLNGIGMLMALLVTGIGSCIIAYALGYMGGKSGTMRLCSLLYLFMFAMTGVVLSDHLLILFIFWELTSISSYMLIGFNHENASARRNALQALVVTGLGGLALLAGVIMLQVMTGTWLLSEMHAQSYALSEHPLYVACVITVLLGAFTKSAQFPFHFWLPNAMSAPTPVSAYLHSATMVKAGIFLMLIMQPMLGGTGLWSNTLMVAGGMTMLLALLFGLRQVDLKKILAATTLAVLGILTLLIGIDKPAAIFAAILFLLGHALYKATLFMTAGAVDHSTGTRDIRVLGSLKRSMPLTAFTAGAAALSMMGLPLFLGFLGKEYAYKASLYAPWVVTGVLVLGNALMMVLAARAGVIPFFRKRVEATPHTPHEVDLWMAGGPAILATLGVAFGCVPMLFEPVLQSCYQQLAVDGPEIEVHLWHGINLPLILSLITFALGFALTAFLKPAAKGVEVKETTSADGVYDKVFQAVLRVAHRCTGMLQTGNLRSYLVIILVSTCALILLKLFRYGGWPSLEPIGSIHPFMLLLLVAMLIATAFAVFSKRRLTAVISLGVVGYGVAMIFAKYSAPDLAITQVLVETLTVVLFAWVVKHLPRYRVLSTKFQRVMDGCLALLTGGVMTVLMIKSQHLVIGDRIADTLTQMSYPLGNGANVVNVILVDFRALDTFGEITVLAVAALGVWALVEKVQKEKK
ncbi:hydrogen gas-evolving membrane-bound hydrogenase subunit E [Rubritalea spongiae]|uniref:Hydrogen gas-evolving membrane-bound hydrogenase subunit E n=1 Tax=Rubritalea spongiae TaxID=430797 RepID=A0ABW5E2X1_9BACT